VLEACECVHAYAGNGRHAAYGGIVEEERIIVLPEFGFSGTYDAGGLSYAVRCLGLFRFRTGIKEFKVLGDDSRRIGLERRMGNAMIEVKVFPV